MAPTHFTNDLAKLTTALAPHTFTDGDFTGISPSAPSDLVRPYRALIQRGYANGWLR